MNTQSTPKNPLLNPVSAATKARVVEAIFPNPTGSYEDEITNNLTYVNRVLRGLSILSEQNEIPGGFVISGDFVVALSELLGQQVGIAIVLLQGSVLDGNAEKDSA